MKYYFSPVERIGVMTFNMMLKHLMHHCSDINKSTPILVHTMKVPCYLDPTTSQIRVELIQLGELAHVGGPSDNDKERIVNFGSFVDAKLIDPHRRIVVLECVEQLTMMTGAEQGVMAIDPVTVKPLKIA